MNCEFLFNIDWTITSLQRVSHWILLCWKIKITTSEIVVLSQDSIKHFYATNTSVFIFTHLNRWLFRVNFTFRTKLSVVIRAFLPLILSLTFWRHHTKCALGEDLLFILCMLEWFRAELNNLVKTFHAVARNTRLIIAQQHNPTRQKWIQTMN